MKKKIIICLFILGFPLYGQDIHFLENAYTKKSKIQLSVFLDSLYEEQISFYKEHTQTISKIEETVYQLYKVFYNPKDTMYLKYVGEPKLISDSTKYIIIQDTILALITGYDSFKDHTTRDLDEDINNKVYITNFCPDIGQDSIKVIYFNKKIKNILSKFLFSKFEKNECLRINMDRKEEVFDRVRFLNTYLRIIPSHWLNYWLVGDYPRVVKIYFNNDLSESIVCFEVLYQYGEAFYKKINGSWKLQKFEIVFKE